MPLCRSSEPCPVFLQQWKRALPTSRKPEQLMRSVGCSVPASSPASATHILNVDPGAYRPATALLISGVRRLLVHSCHCACEMPELNRLGSNDGLVAIASTSP